jgi:hypothetical protein
LFVVADISPLYAQCAQNNLPREVSTPDLLHQYKMSFWQVRRSRNPQDAAGIGTATVVESYPDEGRILLLTASHVTQSSFGLDPPSDGSHPSPNPSTLYLFNPTSTEMLEAREIASGNPNKLDIAIIEVRTQNQLLLRAMTPIGIQLSRPRVGSNIRLVGYPTGGTVPVFDGSQRQVGSYDPNVDARFYSSIGQGFSGQSGSLAIHESLPTAIGVYKGPEPIGARPSTNAPSPAQQDRLRFTPTSYAMELLELISTTLRSSGPSKTIQKIVEEISRENISDVTMALIESPKLSDIEYATLYYSLAKMMSDPNKAASLRNFFATGRGRALLVNMNQILVCRGMANQGAQFAKLAYENRLVELSVLASLASDSVLQILPIDRIAAISLSPGAELTASDIAGLKAATEVLSAARASQVNLFAASEIERSADSRFAFRALGYSAVVLGELSNNNADRDSALNLLRLAERSWQIPAGETKYRAVSYSLASKIYANANRSDLARSASFTADYWKRQAPNPFGVFLVPDVTPRDRSADDYIQRMLGAAPGDGRAGLFPLPQPRLLPQIEAIR